MATNNLSKRAACEYLSRDWVHALEKLDESVPERGNLSADKHNEQLLDAVIDALTRLRSGRGRQADDPIDRNNYAGTQTPAELALSLEQIDAVHRQNVALALENAKNPVPIVTEGGAAAAEAALGRYMSGR